MVHCYFGVNIMIIGSGDDDDVVDEIGGGKGGNCASEEGLLAKEASLSISHHEAYKYGPRVCCCLERKIKELRIMQED